MLIKSKTTAGLFATVLWMSASSAFAASYYVATTGNDSTGDGSTGKPWKTIGAGLNKLASGDTLIVKAGTYNNIANFINSRNYRIPSGTAAKYTTVMAETPGSVRIGHSGTLDYYDGEVFLGVGTNYVRVDGFVFEQSNTEYPPYMAWLDGNYNKITRSIFKRVGPTEQYGGWIVIEGNDNLVEDSAGVGSARYGFSIGGPSSTAQRNILRRVVGRVDYSISSEPKATFNVYGNDNGSKNVRDVLLQNCIAVDGRKGPSTGDVTYGAYYFPKDVYGVKIQGSIALNVEAEYAGFFIKELGGENVTMVDSVAWGSYGASYVTGIRANANAAGVYGLDHLTIGANPAAYWNRESATTRILKNSLFFNNTALTNTSDYGWTTATNNAFVPSTQAIGSAVVAAGTTPIKYLVRAETGSAIAGKGSDGADVGANVTKRYGKTGTRWGEPGYDTVTTESLWPWLYEDNIKAVFAETNTPPAGAVPSTNNTTRGFAAATDKFGKPMTLTRYVWQYLGNEIPADVYGSGTTPMQPPTNLRATVLP